MKQIVSVIVVVLFVVIIAFLKMHDVFTKIQLTKKNIEQMYIVHVKYIGEYSKSGKAMNELYFKLLNEEKIVTYKGIGFYFDNPKNVNKNELRSIVGCVLEKEDEENIEMLKTKGYNISMIPQNESTVSVFKYLSPMSIVIGLIKVYPVINKFSNTQDTSNPITEIYDIKGKQIVYSLNDGLNSEVFSSLLK